MAGDLVPAPADPERFGEAVRYHRLSAFAAEAMQGERLVVPAPEARRIRDEAAMRGLLSRSLAAELAAIEPLLTEGCSHRPLVLKGPAAARLYPDPALRPFADLDLLLPRDRLEAGAAALAPRGFEPLVEFAPGFGETLGHDLHLRRLVGRRSIDVELHWRVGDDDLGRGLSHERLRDGARPFAVAGAECMAPAPESELLALAMHLLSDRDKRMIWVCDVHFAAGAASAAQWQAAFALADELGLLWPLHRALDYAERHLGLERQRPLEAGEPPAWGPLRAVEEVDARASLHLGRLASLRGRDRVRYLARVLVPSRAGLRGTVGRDGAPTWRLLGRHVRAMFAGVTSRRR